MISLIDEVRAANGYVLEIEFTTKDEYYLLPNALHPFSPKEFVTAYDFGVPLPGSTATCEETGKNYVYNNQGVWVEGAAPLTYLETADIIDDKLYIRRSDGSMITFRGGGQNVHNALRERDADNAHPMSSITGLCGQFSAVYERFERIEKWEDTVVVDGGLITEDQ